MDPLRRSVEAECGSGERRKSERHAAAHHGAPKKATLGVFACVLAFASIPGHALSFDFPVTDLFGTTPGTVTGEIDGGGLLGLILACGGLVGWWRRCQKIA
jgi:hypothetical protein